MNWQDEKFTTLHHRNLWGEWTFVFEKSKLCSLRYSGSKNPCNVKSCAYANPDVFLDLSSSVSRTYKKAIGQLNQYLNGKLTHFDIPLKIYGTEFQKQVWQATAQIPYGETRTYKQIAESIGHPKSSRAVGQALHVNLIQIIIPCHRVIGQNENLTGYALGIDIKRRLLSIEGSLPTELNLE
ncbi:MAG: methylated-DNA--[protein]-cysteine S-methyltransferase [Fibrobacter sp.]|nr:methylated-DNA--[protein]-cysteine S-methyltransferase [Fibrobacter sp.]